MAPLLPSMQVRIVAVAVFSMTLARLPGLAEVTKLSAPPQLVLCRKIEVATCVPEPASRRHTTIGTLLPPDTTVVLVPSFFGTWFQSPHVPDMIAASDSRER